MLQRLGEVLVTDLDREGRRAECGIEHHVHICHLGKRADDYLVARFAERQLVRKRRGLYVEAGKPLVLHAIDKRLQLGSSVPADHHLRAQLVLRLLEFR